MSKPVMFNGRLNKNELDVWIDLLNKTSESSCKSRDLAKQFLALPESISFVSSVENQIIGGTTIYRDRTRLSMVLISVAVNASYRDSAAYQIVKSSLPFFKTVAIRDVDVLIASNRGTDQIGFPLSQVVDTWARDVIERVGFREVAKIRQLSFEVAEKQERNIRWDEQPNLEGAKELIWDQSKSMGLTNSLVWTARDFAMDRRNLMTASADGKVIAVAGLWKIGKSLTVSPFVTDSEALSWVDAAKVIIGEGEREIHLPIIGNGQLGLVEELENMTQEVSSRELSLLRKPL